MKDSGKQTKEQKPRGRKGTGCVLLRKGVWYAMLKFKGRRYRWSSRSSRKGDATALLDQKRRELMDNTYRPGAARITVRDLRDAMIADLRANGRKYETRVRECYKHVERLLGTDTPASQVEDRVDWYVKKRLAETVPHKVRKRKKGQKDERPKPRTYSRAQVNRELACLRRGFRLLLRRRRLSSIPHVQLLAEHNVRTRCPSRDEVESVLRELPVGLREAMLLLSIIPWRVREALNLCWRHVDEHAGCIRHEAADYKSGRAARVLPYAQHPVLAQIIAERRRLTDSWQKEHGQIIEHVFWHEGFDEHGHLVALPYRTYGHTWARACKRAKVADLHVHDLKRFSTGVLTKASVDEGTIMRLAGWRSRSMFDRYSVRSNEDLADGVRKLAEAVDLAEPGGASKAK